jgi:undecaprenyl-diphosphatase
VDAAIHAADHPLARLTDRELAMVCLLAEKTCHRAVVAVARAATRLGDWPLSTLLVVLLLVHRNTAPALAFLAATAAGLLGQKALKRRWGRLRPCQRPGGPPQRAPIPDSGSFPSGHTLHATLSAVAAALFLPVLAPAFALVALLVGSSRVILGVHYPSDVAAGAALGGLLGAAVGMVA